MASALLATSVGAFAQISNPAVVTPAIEEGRWYALGVGSGSWTEFVGVSQNADGVMEFKVLDQTDPNTLNSLAKIDSALWKITPVAEGQNVVRFKLTNKATGLELSFDTKNAVDKFTTAATDQSKLIGGSTEYWYWYAGRNAAQVNSAEELTVNFHNGDSTMVIKRASDDVLYVAKDVNDGAATPGGITLQVLNPGTWVMSASDLNTKGDKVKYMELSFAEGAEANNPFAGKLQAQQLIGNPDTVGGTSGTVIPFSKYMDPTDGAGTSLVVEKGWSPTANSSTDNTVILNKLNEDGELTNSYLHIDTTYYKGSGADLMRYNEIDFSTNTVIPVGSENAIDTLGYNLPVDAFRFMFTKNLLTDSIKVETFSSFVKMNTFMTPKNQKGNAVTQYTMIGTSGVADAQRFGVTSGNYNAALRDSRGNVVTSGGTLITSLVADGVQNNVYPLNNVLSICELTGGDVATAVTESSDCVMLSGESANGLYPIEACSMQAKIAGKMEKYLDYEKLAVEAYDSSNKDNNDAIANSIANTALLIGAKLIVCFTETGRTAIRISKARPCCPIVAVTNNKKTAESLGLYWGVFSSYIPTTVMPDFIEEMEVIALMNAIKYKIPSKSTVIVAGGTPTGSGNTNFMRIVYVPEIRDV